MRTHEECLAFIEKMQDAYAEKRSDVSDNCQNFLEGNDDLFYTEHRYITAKVPGTERIVQYDTLTTRLEAAHYDDAIENNGWKDCEDHEYTGD